MVIARFASSKGDQVYEVVAAADNRLTCGCRGFQFRQSCSHVDAVERWREWGVQIPDEVLPPPAQWVLIRQTETDAH